MKTSFTYLGGLIALAVLLWYAHGVWTRKIPAHSPASWLMWTILDFVIFVSTYASRQPAWLPGAWTLGAGIVTITLFVRGTWSWSYKETICAIGALVTTLIWYQSNSFIGLFAGIISMEIAGMPLWIDMWKNPERDSWPLWFFTVVACICTLLGSDWTFFGIVLAASSLIYNGSLTWITLFKKKLVLVTK